MKQTARGFTIVELLIGILAAISVVAYGGISTKAHDAAIQQDLGNYAKKAELFKLDNSSGAEHYPTAS